MDGVGPIGWTASAKQSAIYTHILFLQDGQMCAIFYTLARTYFIWAEINQAGSHRTVASVRPIGPQQPPPFPTNMLDAKGKTKVLTSEAAEKSASVDPQHQITTNDTKGKGFIQEGTSSGRPPRSGIVITHMRHQETWQQHEDRYRRQQEDHRREEERRRQEWNRHKDHWNFPFFIHCWEQNIKLPTVRDCLECNGYDRHNQSDRYHQDSGLRFNGPIRGRTSVHDRLGGRLSVHDRLGERVGYFPRNQEELESASSWSSVISLGNRCAKRSNRRRLCMWTLSHMLINHQGPPRLSMGSPNRSFLAT